MRINKYLAESGICSRRAADKLILDGVVKKNGKTCAIGEDVDVIADKITVDGKPVGIAKNFEYYIMNKPKGYVCTAKDEFGRKTVMELIDINARLFTVGRLDYDTEGLLLLTTNGDVAQKLTHPKSEIPKTYVAKIEGGITEAELEKLRNGVIIDGKKTAKSKAQVTETDEQSTKVEITIKV